MTPTASQEERNGEGEIRRQRGSCTRRFAASLLQRRAVFLTNARWFGVALCWLPEPGTCGIAPPPRLNVDFVVNTALFVKTLQVRQQGRLRESHRLWCWPQRSSHGRDQLGYRPCTLTRGPAPKSTQPCLMSQPSSSYVFLRNSRGEVLKKSFKI